MRLSVLFAISAGVAILSGIVQAQPPQPPPGGGRGGRGAITSPRNAYPERPAGDPTAIARGKALYSVNCQFCHGADTRGGDGGPSPTAPRCSPAEDDGQARARGASNAPAR